MITVVTKYDKPLLAAFYRRANLKRLWLFILLLRLDVGAVFSFSYAAGEGEPITVYVVLLVLLNLIFLFKSLVYPKIANRKLIECEYTNTVTLDDESVKFRIETTEGTHDGEYFYSAIVSAERDSCSYYLFLTRTKAIVLARNGLQGCTEDELVAYLKTKLDSKIIKFR